jgi:hypothetical protein
MGIAKRWSRMTQDALEVDIDTYGVYELADRAGHIIYVGQGRIRERLASHSRGDEDPCTRAARFFRFEMTGGKERAEQRERALMRDYARTHGGGVPRCNEAGMRRNGGVTRGRWDGCQADRLRID